jgi:hypothetical protein
MEKKFAYEIRENREKAETRTEVSVFFPGKKFARETR